MVLTQETISEPEDRSVTIPSEDQGECTQPGNE